MQASFRQRSEHTINIQKKHNDLIINTQMVYEKSSRRGKAQLLTLNSVDINADQSQHTIPISESSGSRSTVRGVRAHWKARRALTDYLRAYMIRSEA